MRYLLLFRGLNVGGRNRVTMTELAALLTGIGLTNVQTYIQSGNATVETGLGESALRNLVEASFAARFGFESSVSVQSASALAAVVAGLPFSPEQVAAAAVNPDVEHLYVYFLPEHPSTDTLTALAACDFGEDAFAHRDRAIYLLCAESVRTSKGAQRLSRFFPLATARNWKTVLALQGMLEK